MEKKKVKVFSYAAAAELVFRSKGYDDAALALWCIREAYDTPFLKSKEEFVRYALALYEAQKWADNLPSMPKKRDEFAGNICKGIINLIIGK